jgi:hypothetical protein
MKQLDDDHVTEAKMKKTKNKVFQLHAGVWSVTPPTCTTTLVWDVMEKD